MLQYIKILLENQYASGAVLSAIGVIIGLIGSRITSKLSLITFSVSTSKLGQTTTNDIHGEIEVHHKGRKLPNFYFSNIAIRNSSNNDLDNIGIIFYVGEGVSILSDFIRYDKAVRNIPYSSEYQEIMQNPDDSLFFTRREYLIPVLNRGQTIRLELTMTHSENVAFPRIHASMVHKGAKLIERPISIEFHGIPVYRTLPWAIIIGLFLYLVVSVFFSNIWFVGALMLIYGFFAQHVTAITLKSLDYMGESIGILPPSND